MSEQEQTGTTYSPEQFEEVRRARHAVRKALSTFYHVLTVVEGVDTYAVQRLSRKSQSAMKGRPGYTQEQQVQRFDWVTENIEAIKEALSAVEDGDAVAAKALELAHTVLDVRVTPLVEEGRKVAAERDFPSYMAWKQAYKARGHGYVAPSAEVDDDDVEDDEG
jgi:hypothetical protein